MNMQSYHTPREGSFQTPVGDCEEQMTVLRFSDEECIDDDENEYTLRCKFDDDDEHDDQKTVSRDFRRQRLHHELDLEADEVENDQVQRNFSVRSTHPVLTNDEGEVDGKCCSASQLEQMFLSPDSVVINHNYFGVNAVQIGEHNTCHHQRTSRVSIHF